jgi:hypothetical protein
MLQLLPWMRQSDGAEASEEQMRARASSACSLTICSRQRSGPGKNSTAFPGVHRGPRVVKRVRHVWLKASWQESETGRGSWMNSSTCGPTGSASRPVWRSTRRRCSADRGAGGRAQGRARGGGEGYGSPRTLLRALKDWLPGSRSAWAFRSMRECAALAVEESQGDRRAWRATPVARAVSLRAAPFPTSRQQSS